MASNRQFQSLTSAPVRAWGIIRRLARLTAASRDHFGIGAWRTLRRALDLRLKRGITLPGIYKAALTDPALTPEDLDNYTSRPHFLELNHALSLKGMGYPVHNKAVFHRLCDAQDIPTPGWLAFFLPRHPGLARDGTVLAGRSAWTDFFRRELRNRSFVIKEAETDYGASIRIFEPAPGGESFSDALTHRVISMESLYTELSSAPRHSCFIFQQRIHNHDALRELSASTALQTVRTVTFIDSFGRFSLLWAKLRCVAENEVQDNFNNYRGGRIELILNPTTGVVEDPQYIHEERFGTSQIDLHPRTQRPFRGFQIPDWEPLRMLAERAARAFLPTRWIGWDIAPTRDGPLLIEGNAAFDTFLLHGCRPLLEEDLARLERSL